MKPLLHLAPVKGVTDRTFRTVFVRHFGGLDSVLAPFVRITDSESKIKSLAPDSNPGIRTVPQILTKSPSEFIALSKKFEEYGCDEVNWNLGCPFPMAVKKGEGAAMLRHPDDVNAFLDRVFPAVSLTVSVKMRTGMESHDEILKLIPVLNSYPVKDIIIHPRTGIQMYDGEVNTDAFSSALKLSSHPVIYNGDIKTADDYQRLSGMFPGVKGWMIGRGILSDPFLAMEIKNGRSDENITKLVRLKQFVDYLFDAYQEDLHSQAHVLDKLKGVWFYLSEFFPDSRKIDKRIKKAQSLNHYRDEVTRIFDAGLY